MVPPRRGHVSAAQRHTVLVRRRCHRRCVADVHLMDSQTRLSVWNALRTKTVHHRSQTNLRTTPSHCQPLFEMLPWFLWVYLAVNQTSCLYSFTCHTSFTSVLTCSHQFV